MVTITNKVSVAGELYIGGVGVARGYLNRPELTAEKFLPNPFSDDAIGDGVDSRLYKTGDLCRWLPNGAIEYLGRMDDQVKIRGFRIELGEIEAALVRHPDVQEAAVVIREDEPGEKRLVAFVASDLVPTRIPYESDCRLECEGRTIPLQTAELCTAGALLEGEASFEKGKKVYLNVRLPGQSETRRLQGRVAYCRAATTGIDFKLSPEEQFLMEQGVTHELEHKGFLEFLQYSLRDKLRFFLAEKLPDYMVPSDFILLISLPLTPNGKVDRRALSERPIKALQFPEKTFAPPRTPEEESLAGILAEVLDIPRVGIHDDFFALGGHSLLATQVLSRIRDKFGVQVPLLALFEHPTVAGLDECIRATPRAATPPPIPPVDRASPLPLSFAQQRLWFLDRLEGKSATYNIVAAVRLDGDLDLRALEQSLESLVTRHESLRTVFPTVDGAPVARIVDEPWELAISDLSALPSPERESTLQRLLKEEALHTFDLATGPLFRARLIRLGETTHILQVNLHHIIADGWSMGVFVQEWRVAYEFAVGWAKERSDVPIGEPMSMMMGTAPDGSASTTNAPKGAFAHPTSLPPLPIQYVDFANWQRQWLTGEVLDGQLTYWKRQLAGAPALLELPTDHPRPPVQRYRGASLTFSFPDELTARLNQLSQQTGSTLFMTLWSVFAVLLARYSGQDDIVIGSPIANRTHSQTESLIGFFVNTQVLRLDLSGNPSFAALLEQASKVALDAYAHQDVPFEHLVEALQPPRNLSHAPFFQVMFVLQNAPLPDLELPGLALSLLEQESVTAKFDLTLELS
uniref:AMP-binding enzyme C-terminal domain-containing protein n=1 Tax=Candidatus Kentrum sp. UNK TaxID=2126344 RepID=A0A451AX55_9GAMM|nr:MAG: AMP-binding enzyme C-terminal domain-containing protein [Candidatus Kentron sp. UNK]VFK70644.1 MAG: AMP-binding enzyme C-terminal domain-containing protein [Candidatus Kentron sp. UNK]